MGDTNPTLLLVGLIALILTAVGLFVFIITALGGRGGSSKKAKPILGQTSKPDSTPAASVPQASELPVTKETTPDHPGEVMRIIRDQQTGRILVQVDGQQYAHIREIKDAQVGRRVLWAIADLLRFTGGMAANPQALQNIQRPEEKLAAQPAAQREPATTTTQAASLPLAPRKSPRPPLPEPTEEKLAVGKSISTFFSRGFRPAGSSSTITSFIDQVEAILQNKIETLPTPPPRDVHVQSGPNGALEIQVGLDIYNSPGEVPDPAIRKLIQDAVAEWENS
ncbi:MAG: hypothetical protein JXA89_23795 [Anaerolineae bacterium]|nr:hypothetical protein [Anaerolineae bacterium]